MVLRELLLKLGLSVDEASFAKGQLAAKAIEIGLHKIVELGHALAHQLHETLEAGDKIKKTSQSIGVATDALQELQYAGSLADLSAEEMSQAIGILSRNMNAAKEGSEEMAKAFKGVDFKQDGKLKDADEVLASIADKFHKMPDGAEKTALAMQLFGKAGKQMIPLLNEGAAGLEEMRAEARELGLVLDKEAIENSEKLNDNVTRLKAVTTGLWRQALGPLIPALNKLVERFLAWKKANAALIAQKIREWIGFAIKAVNGLIVVFRGVVRVLGFFVDIVKKAFDGILFLAREFPYLTTVVLAVAAAFALLTSPILLLTGFFGALFLVVEDLIAFMQGKDSLFGRWKKKIDEWIKPQGDDPWWLKAIKEFISALTKALALMDELFGRRKDQKDLESMANRGQTKLAQEKASDQMTIATAKKRVSMGLPLTEREKVAIGRAGISEASFMDKFGTAPAPAASFAPMTRAPEVRGPAASAPVANTSMSIGGINIYQQPGESSTDLASRVNEVIESHWQSKMEEAASGLVP